VSDDRIDDLIHREAKRYRDGAPPPAERMWSRIEVDVARAIRPSPRTAPRWPWIAATTGIAAALVIGVAVGRNMNRVDGPTAAVTPPPAASLDSARVAVMRGVTSSHFVQAEVFLTSVRADLHAGRHDPQRAERSRQLLARTRLLMAQDANRPLPVARLLEDLELVLAEIAALPDTGERRPMDAQLLDERLRVGTVLPRIRTILPSPPATGGS
jgi:hypothetical protein